MPLKSRGLLADRPALPLPGDEYTATDTQQKFTCFVTGTWVEDQQSQINIRDSKDSARAATTAALPASTYANGTAGVGATLTADANGVLVAQDGVTLVVGNRLLVKDQAAGLENGIYTITDVGGGAAPWILTRATDGDSAAEVTAAIFLFIEEGTINADAGFELTTNNPITIGTTSLTFASFTANLLHPVVDTTELVKGSADGTKRVRIEADGLTTATTRVATMPDKDVTLGLDAEAIHDNVAAEISAVTEKATPVGADLLLIEDSAAANAKKRVKIENLPVALPPDYINGAAITWVSITSIKAGTSGETTSLRDKDNTFDISFSGEKTAVITTAGKGGLDTGAEAANTWYALHVIGDSAGVNAPDVVLSLSATAPTLPAGYDKSRRVGWVRNNGSSNFLKFNQRGAGRNRRYVYDETRATVQVLTSGSATTFTTISLAAFMPPTSEMAILSCSVEQSSAAGGAQLRLRTTGDSVSEANAIIRLAESADDSSPSSEANWASVEVETDSSQQIDYAQLEAADDADIYVQGFIDEV